VKWLAEHPDAALADLAWTAGCRRSHHPHRLAVVAGNTEQLAQRLQAAGSSHPVGGLAMGRAKAAPQVVFVFPGMGPQWWGMGRELLAQEPAFRAAIAECDGILHRLAGWSLLDELTAAQDRSRIDEPRIAQPVLFALQVALAELWRAWGIVPAAVVGHSVGEVAAAHAAGALSLADALLVVHHRSRLQQPLRGQGRMLAVALSEKEARWQVDQSGGGGSRVSVAAVNSPGSITLSGDEGCLEEIHRALQARGTFCRLLQGDVPYHSPLMDPLGNELLRSLHALEPRVPSVPLYSTVTGEPVRGPDLHAAHWWRNVRQPVLFAQAAQALVEAGHETFLEVGPHPVLAAAIRECADALHRRATVLASLRRREPERPALLNALAQLWTAGHAVRWERVNPPARPASLPPYPWQRERFWRESEESGRLRQGHVHGTGPGLLGEQEHPLLGRPIRSAAASATGTRTWHIDLDLQVDHPWLADHRIQGTILYPAAAYLETALWVMGDGNKGLSSSVALERVELHRPLVLDVERPQALELVVEDDLGRFSFFGRDPDGSWTRLASGQAGRASAPPPSVPLDEVRGRCPVEVAEGEWYRRLEQAGYHYGPCFRSVRAAWCGDAEALAVVAVPEPLDAGLDGYLHHPALIDACLQVCLGTLSLSGMKEGAACTYVPRAVERVVSHRRAGEGGSEASPGPLWCHARHAGGGEKELCDIRLFDVGGRGVLEIVRLQFVLVAGQPAAEGEQGESFFHEYRWLLQPRDGVLRDGMPPLAQLLEEIQPRAARAHFERDVKPGLDALCVAYVVQAFAEMSWRPQPGRRISTEALACELGVAPAQGRFFAVLLDILAEEGALRQMEDAWEECDPPQPRDPVNLWRDLLARVPACLAELTLLGRVGPQVAGILRGQVDPGELLHPGGAAVPALEHLASSGPSVTPGNLLVRAALSALLRLLPPERPLRILEVGDGVLTASLLPLLPRHRTTCLVAAPSPQALDLARQRFGAFPFVGCSLLEHDHVLPPAQIESQAHDIILCSDLAHPPVDPRRALPRLRRLLAPGGMLVHVLLPRADRFGTLVFGALPDSHPCTVTECKQLLTEEGFTELASLDDGDGRDRLIAIIAARSPLSDASAEEHLPPFSLSQAASLSAAQAAPRPPGWWLLFADQGGVASALAERLRQRGERAVLVRRGDFRPLCRDCFQADPERPEDMRRLLQELPGGPERFRGIVHLWSLDAEPAGETLPDWPDDAHALGCLSVLHLVQASAAMRWAERPRLYLVTRGAQPVRRGEVPAVGQGTLWGLGRNLRSEHPELRCTLIDLGAGSPQEARSLLDELLRDDVEDEVALRGSDRLVHRLVAVGPDEVLVPELPAGPAGRPFRLVAGAPGLIDSLRPRRLVRRPPEPGEVEIEVHAAGLNFKDVAKVLNLLGDDSLRDTWSGRLLGLECAGRVVARGEGVTDFQVGDAVVAQAAGALASHVTVDACLVAHKPPQLGFEEAATVPVAFLTAGHALFELARLRPGERVLIHSAAGGVGLAAAQLARRAGAEVFATAGSPEKRQLLRLLGVAHVMDSRSLGFAHEVLDRTGGRGVDVVLSSLAGPALAHSLALLGTGGRFLELGKRGIEQNARLPLRPFQKHVAFFAIDLDRFWAAFPEAAAESFQRVMRELGDGLIRPLPFRAFPAAQARDAFRWMARARHAGKVVLTMKEDGGRMKDEKGSSSSSSFILHPSSFSADASYLITGGLGGFGLATARWLVEQGARRLVLVGRKGAAGEEALRAVAALEGLGAEVLVRRADVCHADELAAVLDEVRRTLPPLRGVFHAPMVQDEALLLHQDRERFHQVMAPKVAGAVNLHRLTAADPLDHFVLFSSATSLFGPIGLSSYAAANAFLDGLAHYRRARGLPGLAVNWTAVADAGYLGAHQEARSRFEQMGFTPLPSGLLLRGLGVLLESGAVQTAIVKLDRSRKAVRLLATLSPTYSSVAPRQGSDPDEPACGPAGGPSLRDLLRTTEGQARQELLTARLREQVGQVLGIAPERIDLDVPLIAVGLDSLMAIDLGNRVRNELGAEVPVLKLLGGATLGHLVHHLQEQLAQGAASARGQGG
jgi:acyl transferase domain-containing protein/acyl carrier protein